jgi:hypothetical protein
MDRPRADRKGPARTRTRRDRAGLLEMLDTHPVLVIAFTLIPGGTPGTRHTLTNASRRGIPVVIVTRGGQCSSTR